MSGPGRIAVVIVAPESVSLGVYERPRPDRIRAHARRHVALEQGDPQAWREAVRGLVSLARGRGALRVMIVARASLTPARRRQVKEEARSLRCECLAPTPAEELRWIFLGAIRDQRAADGLVAEVEPAGIALARWRGRVLASTARLPLRGSLAQSGIPPGRPEDALVVTGSLAAARPAAMRGAAATALRRLLEWTGRSAARLTPHALADGVAATLLEAPIPAQR